MTCRDWEGKIHLSALNCSQSASATLISIVLKEGIPYRCPSAVLVCPSPTSVWALILLSVQNPLPSTAFSGQNILWPRFNSNDTQSFPPPRGTMVACMRLSHGNGGQEQALSGYTSYIWRPQHISVTL